MSISVAIVEDDPGLLESIKRLVDQTADLRCVAACADGESALAQIPASAADVVLMDINLSGISGIECVRRLRPLLPGGQIMMLTILEDYDKIFQSIAAGAMGYLLKKDLQQKLLESIRELHAGGSPMTNSIARKVVLAFYRSTRPAELEPQLSDRERQILERLSRGHMYKEIADDFGISFHTVRTHIQNIYKKLHVCSRAEAVELAHSHQDLKAKERPAERRNEK